MCKQKESGPETDSMKCCKEKCPHENEILNKAHCQSVVCGQDGHTYTGICALDECGKTVGNLLYYQSNSITHFIENTM